MTYFDSIYEMQTRLKEERDEVLEELHLEPRTYRDFYDEVSRKMNYITTTTNNTGLNCITLFGVRVVPAKETAFKTKSHRESFIDRLYKGSPTSPYLEYDLSFLRTRE